MIDDAVYPKYCIDKVCSHCDEKKKKDEMAEVKMTVREIKPKATSKPF